MIPIRDDTPTRRVPWINYLLLGVLPLVFVWQLGFGPEMERVVYALGLIPAVLFGHASLPTELQWVPPPATVLTSMFLHGGLLHLGSNMLYLWIFGNNVEDSMGHTRFIIFYVLCGIAAAAAHALPNTASEIPMIGASGAISGVLGAYILLHPYARILTMVPLGFVLVPFRIPAVILLGVWIGFQFLQSLALPTDEGGVAFRAHVGGFVAGMVMLPLFRRRGASLPGAPRGGV